MRPFIIISMTAANFLMVLFSGVAIMLAPKFTSGAFARSKFKYDVYHIPLEGVTDMMIDSMKINPLSLLISM